MILFLGIVLFLLLAIGFFDPITGFFDTKRRLDKRIKEH